MKKRDYGDFVQDILDSINYVENFIDGMEFEDFIKDKKTIYSVVRAIEIIGEAAKTSSDVRVIMMRCIALTGISNHVINDLKNRLLRTIEIRSLHNFSGVLRIDIGDPVFLSTTSPNDITAGTTVLVARLQRRDISIHRVVQSNDFVYDFVYEEREAMMARVQLVAEGSGRVQRIIQSELGSAMVVDVEERPVCAAQ